DMQSNVNPPVHTVQVETNSASFANGFWNFDKVNSSSLLMQQTNAYIFVFPQQNDCWCWAVAGVYLKSDSCTGCGIIGIHEAEPLIKDIRVSPNPATDIIRVQASEILVESIEIFNVMGKIVSFVPFSSLRKDGHEVVNISHLNPGIFFLKLNAGEETRTLKFVKE
ncbi:MAG TPA: T9SS type A sorting domain-containing protein, partial [Bacteroidia bacterium]|nr:T9SS type A sorting domain-containing protein [Bacteroidia bacterium]